MKKLLQVSGIVYGLLLAGNIGAAADVYKIDQMHSNIGFSIKHMMVSSVKGNFKEYEGSISYDPKDLNSFKSNVTIQVKSIDTNVQKRDDHLRSADFFDIEKHPTITFVSKSLKEKDGSLTLTGDLTMHGVTKEISLPVTIEGPILNDASGKMHLGLSGQTTIDRQDYGIKWNKTLKDIKNVTVGNDVIISIEIEAVKKE